MSVMLGGAGSSNTGSVVVAVVLVIVWLASKFQISFGKLNNW